MNTIQFVRIYHAALAVLAILAYLSAELGIVHVWLGYSVALVIILRLMWVLSGNPNVGLMRFYPSFEGLKLANAFTHPAVTKVFMLGIAVSLLATTATGIAMDKGKAIGLTQVSVVSVAYADDSQKANKHQQKNEEGLKDSHEFFANLLVFFVGLHVCYLLVFKRPLAKFMVFMPKKSDKNA
ncbi:cytochrome b/b6 domain-containing protein [Paraglaciecola sp.]|uniref:cytochrome b/b6 domain-containing protein n=1 Tax=Paraglaciecola sp. TaxID=1920173 RepID=UPI00273F5340|nr:cytochrome b/b6 domain-containing protein [Paraglaciecola sp.]MDP5032639.1 cytochrome b/b6 domain-containing protein [Paraglaciecola sp.]